MRLMCRGRDVNQILLYACSLVLRQFVFKRKSTLFRDEDLPNSLKKGAQCRE